MASWKDLKRFCQNDGWTLVKPTNHYFYEKQLPNGDILRTKVSMGTGEIVPDLFSRILKKQLQVDKKYFNSKI